MSRFQPSLVRRLTVGFIFANALGALLFCLFALFPAMLMEQDEPAGPELALAFIRPSLSVDVQGRPQLHSRDEVEDLARDHPAFWFVAQGAGETLEFGPVPVAVQGALRDVSGAAFQARYRALGADGPTGDAMTQEFQVGDQRVVVTAGGIDSGRIAFGHFLTFIWRSYFLWIPVFTAIFNLAGILVAIPIVLRSVRPTAGAAGAVDPNDLSRRLPERGVVKELLPIVRAFNAALDRVSDAFDRRRRFIADVAHELRTPLAVLHMHIESLPAGEAKPQLQRTVYRLGQMIGQMLDAERLTLAGRRRVDVDLVELARNAVAEAAPLAVAQGYELGLAMGSDKVLVRGDPHAISRAINNLLGNAMAHGGGRGSIEVEVSPHRFVDVKDEGPGLPADARERIFEPFHRERWDRDGCGLGLHLVREIMQSHGGRAYVSRSQPGTVFRLEFPADPDAARAA